MIVSENPSYRTQLLADAIPAESFAVGANSVGVWNSSGNNINMAISFKDRNNFTKSAVQSWVHSLFVGAPYMCVHGLYDDIVSRIPKEAPSE